MEIQKTQGLMNFKISCISEIQLFFLMIRKEKNIPKTESLNLVALKNSHHHFKRQRKAFDKIQPSLVVKSLRELGIEGNFSNQ